MPDDEPPPPWKRFPELPAHDIGWRMAGGEEYLERWWAWAETLTTPQRHAYLHKHAPIPKDWRLWAADVYAYPADDDDALDAAYEALFDAGDDEG